MQNTFKTVHTWTGIIFGVFICVISATGSLLVFKQPIEDAFGPQVGVASPGSSRVSLNEAAALMVSANPGTRLTRVRLPNQSQNSYVFTVESPDKHSRRMVMDAATGRIVGELNTAWLDWTVDLHRNVLAGRTGRQIAGGIGIVMFAMSITGVILSLLRRPRWRSLVRVRSGPPWRRFHYELHRSLGVWSYAFLAVLSFTGVGLAYPDTFRSVLGKPQPYPAVQALKLRAPAEPSLKPLDEYLRISRAAAPDAEFTELRLPKSVRDAVSMRFRVPSDFGEGGRNQISIEATSGEVLAVQRQTDQPFGVRVQRAFTPLHYGEVGGTITKLLWCLAGLSPLVLFGTGLYVWLKQSSTRKAKAADTAVVEQLATSA